MDPIRDPATHPHPRPWPRRARLAGLVLGALLATWCGLHLAADRAWVHQRIRARADEALRARLPEAALGDEVGVDWLFRAWVGPLAVPAAAAGAPPVLRVERILVRLAPGALLAGRLEAASLKAIGVRLAPGPGGRELVRLAERLRAARSRPGADPARGGSPAALPALRVRGLWVDLTAGVATLPIGPLDARLDRTVGDGVETLEGLVALPGGGELTGRWRREGSGRPAVATAPASSWSATLRLSATPDDLPAALRGATLDARGGHLTASLEARGDAAAAHAAVRGALEQLTVQGPSLGPEPVGPLALAGEAELDWSRGAGRLTLTHGQARSIASLALDVDGALDLSGDLPVELRVTLQPVDYQALVDGLPPALAPPPAAPRPAGFFSGRWRLAGPLRRPLDWSVEGDLDLASLREQARQAPPSPLRATFTARRAGEGGPAVVIGPENPAFVPLGALPEHVVRAITTGEDAGFFGHHGFDFEELKNAASVAGQTGRLGRGGSTITQQLAKNLFLSRERTLTRKVKEALVTVALEGTVPKGRLLEIYLNLIEWGPGLHGIGPAARRYFGKDAPALTPREACFLAAAIPSPLRTWAAVAAGVPPERWAARIDDLLAKLGAVGVLTEAELEAARAAPLVFAGGVEPGGAAEAAAAAAAETDGAEASDPGAAGEGAEPPGRAPAQATATVRPAP